MKKIYSLILLAAATLGAQAQVVLQYQGQTVEPGSVLEIRAYENLIDEGPMWEEMGMADYYDGPSWTLENIGKADPYVVNVGSTATEVTATVQTAAWEHFAWCFPDLCKDLAGSTVTEKATLAKGGKQLLALDVEFEFEEYVEEGYDVTLTLSAAGKTDTYTLRFIYSIEDDPHESVYQKIDGAWQAVDGIQGVKADAPAATTRYDLTGRRIQQPAPGQLYIENGRKRVY